MIEEEKQKHYKNQSLEYKQISPNNVSQSSSYKFCFSRALTKGYYLQPLPYFNRPLGMCVRIQREI